MFGSQDFKPVFEHCTKLQSLRINNDVIDDRFFEYLSHCTQLSNLQVSSYGFGAQVEITDRAIYAIAKLSELKVCEIEYFSGLTVQADALIKLLDECSHLEKLVLKRSNGVMLTAASRSKVLAMVDRREAEGAGYVFELEQRAADRMMRYYVTSR